MENVYVPLISGLVGALIGSISSVLTILIQSRYQAKRELVGHAVQIAFLEFKYHMENSAPRSSVLPISIYVHNQVKTLQLIADNKLTPDAIEALNNEVHRLGAAVEKSSQLRRAGP